MAAQYEQKKGLLDYFHSSFLSPLPHLHKELELIYVQNGSCRAVADNKVYKLKSGDLFLTFPYQVHYYPDSEKGDYFVHAFPTSVLVTMSETINTSELVNHVFHSGSNKLVVEYLNRIICADGPYSIAQRCAYLTLIMSELLPQCSLTPLAQSSGMTVRRILEYCSSHYTEDLSLDTLSKNLHLNKYYISHTINKQINMRISTFINSLRIEAACRLLRNSNQKISEVAQAVGYDTIRSFNRAFSEIVHITPKAYREKYASGSPEVAGI